MPTLIFSPFANFGKQSLYDRSYSPFFSNLIFGGFYPFETTVLRGLRRTATRTMTHWPSAREIDFLRGHMYWMRKFASSLVNPPGPPT